MKRASCFAVVFMLCLATVYAQEKLEKQLFLDNRVELLVPVKFKPLPQRLLDIKYPDKGRQPKFVLSDKTSEINLIIELRADALEEDQVGAVKDQQVEALKASLPGSEWKDDGIKTINGKKVGYFKFIVQRADAKIYNYFFFTSFDSRALILSFNCTERFLPEWENIAEKIVNSLKIIEKK